MIVKEEGYCEGCSKKLPENARKGKRHCNSTCRVQAHFRRKFGQDNEEIISFAKERLKAIHHQVFLLRETLDRWTRQ